MTDTTSADGKKILLIVENERASNTLESFNRGKHRATGGRYDIRFATNIQDIAKLYNPEQHSSVICHSLTSVHGEPQTRLNQQNLIEALAQKGLPASKITFFTGTSGRGYNPDLGCKYTDWRSLALSIARPTSLQGNSLLSAGD